MTVEIALPFRFLNGAVAVETDPVAQITQQLTALLTTEPSERVMNSQYGVGVLAYVFEDMELVEQELTARLQTAVNRWMPSVAVIDVSLLPADQQQVSKVTFSVQYQLATASMSGGGGVHTAVIAVDGKVWEMTNG